MCVQKLHTIICRYSSSHSQEVVPELCDQLIPNEEVNADKSTIKHVLSRSQYDHYYYIIVGALYELRCQAYNNSNLKQGKCHEKSRKSQERRRVNQCQLVHSPSSMFLYTPLAV